MRVRLTSAAQAELTDALDWYGALAPAVAARFLDEFEALIGRLSTSLRQFPSVLGEVRRAEFDRFPDSLMFRLGAQDVEVFACFHASRDPRIWRERL